MHDAARQRLTQRYPLPITGRTGFQGPPYDVAPPDLTIVALSARRQHARRMASRETLPRHVTMRTLDWVSGFAMGYGYGVHVFDWRRQALDDWPHAVCRCRSPLNRVFQA